MSENKPQTTTLSPKEARFIKALLEKKTRLEACNAVGISAETGRRWLALPHVKFAYEEAKQEMIEACFDALILDTPANLATLQELRDDQLTPAQVRYNASFNAMKLAYERQKDLQAAAAKENDSQQTQSGINNDILRWLNLEEILIIEGLVNKAEERARAYEQQQQGNILPIRPTIVR